LSSNLEALKGRKINGAVLEMNYGLPQGTHAGFAIHLVLGGEDIIKIIGKYDIVDRRAHEKIQSRSHEAEHHKIYDVKMNRSSTFYSLSLRGQVSISLEHHSPQNLGYLTTKNNYLLSTHFTETIK
jgi:hypothetical protein